MESRSSLDVLIVDDELPLRQELRSYPWEAFGARLIGEAENGEDALEKCQHLQPDVVITDISMPVMDGIHLIKAIQNDYPRIQIILLTCHNEFEFAREALQLGALGYHLKITLTEEEIRRSLEKARKNIQNENIIWKVEREKRRFELTKQFDFQIIRGLKSINKNSNFFSKFESELQYPFHFVRLKTSCSTDDTIFIRQVLMEYLFQLEKREEITWFSVSQMDVLICFFNYDLKALTEKIEETLKHIQCKIDKELSFMSQETSFYAIISEKVQSRTEFIRNVEISTLWKEVMFYDSDNGKNLFTGSPNPLLPMDPVADSELSEIAMLMDWNRDSLISFFRGNFINWCREKRIVPHDLKKWAAIWRLNWLKDRNPVNQENELVQRLLKAATLSEFISALIYDVEIRSGEEVSGRKEIRDAKQIIKKQLGSPLTLSFVAKEVGLSPPYLSKLFHETVGESFKEYITRIRIQKAVELLQNTNLKVYEISEKIGIPSYRYFSVLFRKKLGRSPSDYRKRVMP